MLGIEKVDHVGIRVSDKHVSIAFYERLGFETLSDAGFERGHPVIMRHPSGVVLNLLGPSNTPNDRNILMDGDEKYPGITHVAFKVGSLEATRQFLAEQGIPLSGQFSFKDLRAVFIRDPDRNVIELDAYAGAEPETRGWRPRDLRLRPAPLTGAAPPRPARGSAVSTRGRFPRERQGSAEAALSSRLRPAVRTGAGIRCCCRGRR